jgi:Zn ribbon nucleic-acid-binding protein
MSRGVEDTRRCPACSHSEIMGYEQRGVYDGVLVWGCMACGHAWPRFSTEDWPRLHDKAVEIIEAWKNGGEEE